MKQRLLFTIKYWLLWMFMFSAGRLFFLFVTRQERDQSGFNMHWQSLFHGLRMDASMAAYFTLPVILILLGMLFTRKTDPGGIFKWYTGVLVVLGSLIFMIDAQSFKFWGHRVDASILNYIQDPKEAAASTAHFPLIKWSILLIVVIAIAIKTFNAFFRKNFPLRPASPEWKPALALILLLGVSIIPLRGGIQLAPINQSTVYFSQNNYANQAAVNPVWNFAFSVKRNREVTVNPYVAMPAAEAAEISKNLLLKNQALMPDSMSRKNVILIVWESFTSKVVDSFYGGTEVTPNFNKLKREGLWFSNAFATGDRTDKGIVGILSGYPAQPISSIVKNPEKTRSLPHLGRTFRAAGYHNAFFYGGEMEFANIKSYLLEGNFHRLTDVNSFDKKYRNSKWGAHDGIVKDTFQSALASMPEPFFATWLTLSSHEPYETPVPKVIPGEETVPSFLNSLHYTDGVVGELVSFCKSQSWWGKTLLVIVADHGHRYPLSASEFSNFHIPVLILGGEVDPRIYPHTISQTGLPSTILNMNGLSDSSFLFSRNWLDTSATPWALFSFNNGFGYMKNDSALIFDNIGQKVRKGKQKYSPQMLKEGRALQQFFFDDFLSR